MRPKLYNRPLRLGGRGQLELERTLKRYLELRIDELEREAAAQAETSRQTEVRSIVGQLTTWLVLLATYAVALGLVSRAAVVSALWNPEELVRNGQLAADYGSRAASFLPDAFRGLALSALSAGALLVFRAASFSVRSDIGGAIFVGAAVLSLLGFSAAAYSGAIGFMVALPGFAAAIFIVHELMRSLRRLVAAKGGEASEKVPLMGSRIAGIMDWAVHRVDPTRFPRLGAAFIGLPWLCLALVAGGVLTRGGPMFIPARSAIIVFVIWCIWACAATPAMVRIPLWSTVPWGVLFLTQMGFNPVAQIFAVAVINLLVINVILMLWRGEQTSWAQSASGRVRVRHPAHHDVGDVHRAA